MNILHEAISEIRGCGILNRRLTFMSNVISGDVVIGWFTPNDNTVYVVCLHKCVRTLIARELCDYLEP
jgi:hypothetical protein